MPLTELPEVGPQSGRDATVVRETGTLQVSGRYSLYAKTGRLLRSSREQLGRTDEEFEEVALAVGEYYVVGEGVKGVVRVPLTIAAGRTTVIDLQRRNSPHSFR